MQEHVQDYTTLDTENVVHLLCAGQGSSGSADATAVSVATAKATATAIANAVAQATNSKRLCLLRVTVTHASGSFNTAYTQTGM